VCDKISVPLFIVSHHFQVAGVVALAVDVIIITGLLVGVV
jgi:hypothetical protein